MHPVQHRELTVRERASIMGFPEDWVLHADFVTKDKGNVEQCKNAPADERARKIFQQNKMVGNAVPPPMARAWAHAFRAAALLRTPPAA